MYIYVCMYDLCMYVQCMYVCIYVCIYVGMYVSKYVSIFFSFTFSVHYKDKVSYSFAEISVFCQLFCENSLLLLVHDNNYCTEPVATGNRSLPCS